MEELLKLLFTVPTATVLIIAGLAFLGIGIVGNISGKITPDKKGRIAGVAFGLILLVLGIYFQFNPPPRPDVPTPTTISERPLTPTTVSLPTNTQAPSSTPRPVTPSLTGPTRPAPTSTMTSVPCNIAKGSLAAQKPAEVAKLLCPSDIESNLSFAAQKFEHGWMFDRLDTKVIYVLIDLPNHKTWKRFQDTWQKGDKDDSCQQIPATPTPLKKPLHGFGRVWCPEIGLSSTDRSDIGYGVSDEASWSPSFQPFENGLIFGGKPLNLGGQQTPVFVLYLSDSTWQ